MDIVDWLNSVEDLMRDNMWKKVGSWHCCCLVRILQPAQIDWQHRDENDHWGPFRSIAIHWLHNRRNRNLLLPVAQWTNGSWTR